MTTIQSVSALEILDSRGRPTLKATCHLQSGALASVSIPSGASTGTAEAIELRDGDPKRYSGLGCSNAVNHVNNVINPALTTCLFASQQELDARLITLDGTPDKSHLGANAILAVSLAFARAVAMERKQSLYEYFAILLNVSPRLPRPTINLFSGGKHAGGQVAIQDVLVVPMRAGTIDECLAIAYDIYYTAARQALERFNMRLLRADEGGLAPPFASTNAMLDAAVTAIQAAGYEPGRDVALAVDVASTHFYRDGKYEIDGQSLDADTMIGQLKSWLNHYPIVSIEDGLSEDDWSAWPCLLDAIGKTALVLGDDFLCTNPQRIQRAIDSRAASALLLKVNQIGTLTEAAEAYTLARNAGWSVTVSARSGETEDNWLADLAVGWAADHIKIGSITQSERLAKYNRLLEIETATRLPVAPGPRLNQPS